MGLDLFFSFPSMKGLIMILAIIAGIFVIATKNAIISVFNLIVLYILVAFYLIYIGITYLGISYIIVYIGAIAILFLFVIMMIDIEVVEKKNNNYLPLLFFLLGGFLLALKNILYNLGIVKMKGLLFKDNHKLLINEENGILFNINPRSYFNTNKLVYNINSEIDYNLLDFSLFDKFTENTELLNNIIINSNLMSENDQYEFNYEIGSSSMNKYDFKDADFLLNEISSNINYNNNYLLILPEWDSAISRVTQISAIGDVLYTIYHSYIYIVSIILLLGMVGAIILTAERKYNAKVINIVKPSLSFRDENDFSLESLNNIKPRYSNILAPFIILNEFLFYFIFSNFYKHNKNLYQKLYINLSNLNQKLYINLFPINNFLYMPLSIRFIIIKFIKQFNFLERIYNSINFINKLKVKLHVLRLSGIGIYPFFDILNNENNYSEGISGTLMYYIVSNIMIGLLLLFINSSFSLSVKYLEKGGGFECGFTSFVQTRERYNIIFYRVSLLFLIFDLEIILAFPYPALYQKNQNISKNNLLAFLYILVVGFIYELKEGALNIVKTPHHTDINVKL